MPCIVWMWWYLYDNGPTRAGQLEKDGNKYSKDDLALAWSSDAIMVRRVPLIGQGNRGSTAAWYYISGTDVPVPPTGPYEKPPLPTGTPFWPEG